MSDFHSWLSVGICSDLKFQTRVPESFQYFVWSLVDGPEWLLFRNFAKDVGCSLSVLRHELQRVPL